MSLEEAFKAGWEAGYYDGGEHDCRMLAPTAQRAWEWFLVKNGPVNRITDCKRCDSYARRLDELNADFNQLWDYLLSIGHDPEKALSAKGKSYVANPKFKRARPE